MKDRYEILEQLGEGGAGAVFKGWDKRLQRYVAIKRLLPAEKRDGDGVGTDLAKEAAALSSLQHPNVVSVYDLDSYDGEPCVIMEYLNGENLETTLRRGALTPNDFLLVARQCLEGLVAAHRLGIQHRDIKPSNIMVNWLPNGDFLVKMLDFGLADFDRRPHLQLKDGESSAYGTVQFMAPEQLTRRPVDVRTDLYALGCVLYYALSAVYPFSGKKMEDVIHAHLHSAPVALYKIRPDIPRILSDWVHWLMARDPDERPPNAEEALKYLKGIQSGEIKALPRRRELKTQAVPSVPAASVPSRPAPGPKTARPVLRPTGSVPKAPPPVTGPVASVQQTAAKSKPVNKTSLAIVAGIACVVIWGLVWLLIRPKPKDGPAGNPSLTNASASPSEAGSKLAVKEPPQASLAIWLDAAKGIKRNGGADAGILGEPFDLWIDQASSEGENSAHYLLASSSEAVRLMRIPVWSEASGGGLKSKTKVAKFVGEQNLLFYTTLRASGVPNNKALFANTARTAHTFILVLRVTDQSRRQAILSAQFMNPVGQWNVHWEKGQILVGGAANTLNLPGMALRDPTAFFILTCYVNRAQGTMEARVDEIDRKVSKTSATGLTLSGEPERIRLGANPGSTSSYLHGEIAEILCYAGILDDKTQTAAVDYLRSKYFGN